MQARHWEARLDERVPALGNRTRRQAARTTLGREQLEARLKSFEWQNRQAEEHQRVDVGELRRKLGPQNGHAPRGHARRVPLGHRVRLPWRRWLVAREKPFAPA